MMRSHSYFLALAVWCFAAGLCPGQNAVTPDGIYRITPVRPIPQLRAEALRATPHKEQVKRAPDLVELNGRRSFDTALQNVTVNAIARRTADLKNGGPRLYLLARFPTQRSSWNRTVISV